jgi:hypothetical protein
MEVDSVATAVRWALAYLGVMRALTSKPGVCMDIDGTAIWNASDGSSKCVTHIRTLYDACVKADVAVFFVTARPEEARAHTERQLARCGIKSCVQLCMLPPKSEYGRFKARCRAKIEEQGYRLLLTIGDQFADVSKRELNLPDDRILIGQFGDTPSCWAIKLPSEFADE